MSEFEPDSWKAFLIKSGVVFGLGAALTGWIMINEPKTTTSANSESDANDGRPSQYTSGSLEKSQPQNQNQTSPVSEYTPGYITRKEPRARYKIVPDPLGHGRTCVEKTNESPANTLVGMTIVVAGDPNKYDGSGIIYDGNGNQIGTWNTSSLIGFEDLSAPAYADSVACADN